MASTRDQYSDPTLTYTIEDFIQHKVADDMTYRNFSILGKIDDVEHVDYNLIEEYITELQSLCVTATFSDEEYRKYKYAPDRLAYDLYGSIQLDFIILLINGISDPKEFNMRTVKLPYASVLSSFLSEVYSKDQEYINENRYEYDITD